MTNNIDKSKNLVWIDLEMTGLDINNDTVIEIAVIITDQNLNVIAESESIAIQTNEEQLNKMSDFVRDMHTKNGVLNRVKDSRINLKDAETKVLEFIKEYVDYQSSPLCGNSVHQDKFFMIKYMPNIIEYLHYRIIDVSTIKQLYSYWSNSNDDYKKENSHSALDDIRESISELKYYRSNFFNV